jgi:hypothetical protein
MLVPFSQRREAFEALQARVTERFKGKLNLWIADVNHDRYGLYRPGERKAVVLLYGSELATFDLDKVEA